jgi:hypothetical protein
VLSEPTVSTVNTSTNSLYQISKSTQHFFKNQIEMKNVLITTAHRGVWFAQVAADADLTPETLTDLKNCRMAIYWGTTKGLHELCETGPTKSSKISAPADIPVLHKVTAVFNVTDKAAEAWSR